MVKYDSRNIIEINKEEYYKLYKDIIRTCLTEGHVLPSLLEVIDVPEECDWDIDEEFDFTISKEASVKRQQMEFERDCIQIDVPEDNTELWNKEYVKILNEELLRFIATYPQYNSILKP